MKHFLLGGLFLWISMAAARAGEDNAILPGEGLGQVRLGMPVGKVDELLGPGSHSDDNGKEKHEYWVTTSRQGRTDQTVVDFNRDKAGDRTAWQISVTSPFFRTRGGNTVQSSMEALWNEFPDLHYRRYGDKGDTSHIQMYDDVGRGIAFMIQLKPQPAEGESWGTCLVAIVHRPGERPNLVNLGLPRPPHS